MKNICSFSSKISSFPRIPRSMRSLVLALSSIAQIICSPHNLLFEAELSGQHEVKDFFIPRVAVIGILTANYIQEQVQQVAPWFTFYETLPDLLMLRSSSDLTVLVAEHGWRIFISMFAI